MPIFDQHHPKIVKVILAFMICMNTSKINLFHSFFLGIQPILSPENRVATPIFDHAHPIFLNQLLFSINLYQHAKNQAFSLFCSRDIVDLKIL